jgi:hypothetical protein
MNIRGIVCGVVMAGVITENLYAAATAKISGQVMSTSTTYGAAGAVNRIDLYVFDSDHSSSTWTVTCRRSSANLGWCSNVVQGDQVVSEGYFTTAPTSQLEVTYLGIKNVTLPLVIVPVCSRTP